MGWVPGRVLPGHRREPEDLQETDAGGSSPGAPALPCVAPDLCAQPDLRVGSGAVIIQRFPGIFRRSRGKGGFDFSFDLREKGLIEQFRAFFHRSLEEGKLQEFLPFIGTK